MTRIRKYFRLLIVTIITGAILSGCPRGFEEQVLADRKPTREALEKRIDLLGIEYEILTKDYPPQSDTQPFREKLVRINEAMDKGDLETAQDLILESEEWMALARKRYYDGHLARLRAGEVSESGAELMSRALNFLDKGHEARAAGKAEAADLYYRAAVEQGEAAMVAEQQSPSRIPTLLEIHPQMERIYIESGNPEGAAASRRRSIGHVEMALDGLERMIADRLAGRVEGFEQASLAKSRLRLDKAVDEIEQLNRLYIQIANQARRVFPEAEFQVTDFSSSISAWTRDWYNYHDPNSAVTRKDEPARESQEEELRKKLAEHNKLKAGARPIEESGIHIEETDLYTIGQTVVLKGKIHNLRSESIYLPRITVTGGVMSEVVDLGYFKMSPLMATTFQIPLQAFTADAFVRRGALPGHEILLIYKDSPDGPDLKVIKKIK